MRIYKRAISLLLCILLLSNVCIIPVMANTGSTDTIDVYTADDIMQMSKDLTKDTDSYGKIYRLQNNIDMSGLDFQGIPVFAGTFDGNGYQITGIVMEGDFSERAFIRLLTENGILKNVGLFPELASTGENIAGAVVYNRGLLSNVSVSGHIKASSKVAGIASVNEASGIIISCGNQAVIEGNKMLGGIAGINKGRIANSINYADIAGSDIPVQSEKEEIQSIDIKAMVQDSTKMEAIGGIAGLSTGKVDTCLNVGNIGYPHTSYMTGGIVGINSGVVANTSNKGKINGRKDIGGIVGKLEPYILLYYEEDILDKLRKEIDALDTILGNVSDTVRERSDVASADLGASADAMDILYEELKTDRAYYRENIDKANENIDDYTSQIRDARDDVKDSADDIHDDIKAVIKKPDLQLSLSDINASVEEIQKDIKNRKEKLSDAVSETDTLHDDLNDLSAATDQMLDYMQSEKNQLLKDSKQDASQISDLSDDIKTSLDKTSQNLEQTRIVLQNELDMLRTQMSETKSVVENETDRIKEKISDAKLYTDISTGTISYEMAKVENNHNYAKVYGDSEVGGIIGSVSLDIGENIGYLLEQKPDIDTYGETSGNGEVQVYASIYGNVNMADISAKNDYVGGVVGKANFGAIVSDYNYANISTESGSYAGGIAGYSANHVSASYVMGDVNAYEYVGGIVGQGKDIIDNIAMSTATGESGAKFGVIAGDVSDGVIRGNYYLDEGEGGINGISLSSQAIGLSYEELTTMESLPQAFKKMKLRYIADDEVIKEMELSYSSALDERDIPQIPEKDGYFAYWEEADIKYITRNMDIHAVYEPWQNSVSGKVKIGEKALILASSDFYQNVHINLEEMVLSGSETDIPISYRLYKAYTYDIESAQSKDYDAIELRILNEENKDIAIALKDGETFHIIPSESIGSYEKFVVDKQSGEFLVLEKEKRVSVFIYVVVGIGILGVVYLVYRKMGKKLKETS